MNLILTWLCLSHQHNCLENLENMVSSCRSAQTPTAATFLTWSLLEVEAKVVAALPPQPQPQPLAAEEGWPALPPRCPQSPPPRLSTCFSMSLCLGKSCTSAWGPTGSWWPQGLLWNGRRTLRKRPRNVSTGTVFSLGTWVTCRRPQWRLAIVTDW